MTEKSILDLYRHEVETPRDKHYYHYTLEGTRTISTAEFFRLTSGLASGLEKLGIGHGDRVMLMSDNRPEWHVTDLATMDLGGIDVPIYGTLNAEQVAYQAKDCGANSAARHPILAAHRAAATGRTCVELRLGPKPTGMRAMISCVSVSTAAVSIDPTMLTYSVAPSGVAAHRLRTPGMRPLRLSWV